MLRHQSEIAFSLASLALATGVAAAAPAPPSTATPAPQAPAGAISYPASRALPDISAWLRRDTPIGVAQVVDVNPSAVTAVTSASPMGETRGFLAGVSSEAMDPSIVAHDGIASWSIPVEVDCERRTVRLGAMTGYRSRDLKSEPRIVRAADTNWVNPSPSAPLGAVVRALCDRDFQRPLMGRTKAAAAPRASGPLPRIVVAPGRPKSAPAAAPTAEAAAPAATAGPAGPDTTSSPLTPTPTPAAKATARPGPETIIPPGAAPTPEAAAPPKPKPKPIKTGSSPYVAQIGASPSLPDIQGQIERFKKKFAADLAGLDAHAATVQVEGKTVNRALVSGFAGISDARTFCQRLAAARHPCLVRR